MSEPSGEERILDHDYDGIREYDNPLPRWWVWIFYATILFAPWYLINPGGLGFGKPRLVAYRADSAAAATAMNKALAAAAGSATEESLMQLAKNPSALALGKATFVTNCSPCHRPDAGGLIGPNLTDDYWIHGGKITDIYHTVTNGVLEKGMPQWGKILKPEQISAVVAYVSTLKGTNPPNPKPPQGDKVSP